MTRSYGMLLLLVTLIIFSLACSVSAASANRQPAANTPIPATQKPANTPIGRFPYSALVNVELLNIRLAPSHKADIDGYYMQGETVTIYQCFGVWGRVKQSESEWINTYYISEPCE